MFLTEHYQTHDKDIGMVVQLPVMLKHQRLYHHYLTYLEREYLMVHQLRHIVIVDLTGLV